MLASETAKSVAKPQSRFRRVTGLTRTERADRRFAVIMITPTVIAVLGIMGYPWIYSLWLSLHSVNLLTKRWIWVGVENYTKSFHDETFTSSLVRTIWF